MGTPGPRGYRGRIDNQWESRQLACGQLWFLVTSSWESKNAWLPETQACRTDIQAWRPKAEAVLKRC